MKYILNERIYTILNILQKALYILLYVSILKMKRKIIKQGHNTLTVTLPSEWAKQFNLKSGDEVDMSERENGLFLSSINHDDISKIEINITGLDIPAIWKYFMAVYRQGYDEVKIKFDPIARYDNPYKFYTKNTIDLNYSNKANLTSIEMLQMMSNRFIGFEMIEHQQEFCIVKDMMEVSTKEFDSSLRRVFLLILQMGEELFESLEKNDIKIVQHTHDIDINVDKFHDYCVRVMRKTKIKNLTEASLNSSNLFLLELLADEFKHIAKHLINDMPNKKLGNLSGLAEKVIEMFKDFYDFYYRYDKEKLMNLSKKDREIHSYLPKVYKTKSGKTQLTDSELEIFNHLRVITKYINSLSELRVEMEHLKKS